MIVHLALDHAAGADELRAARLAAGLTQQDLAVIAGVDRNTVCRIERKVVRPTRGTMKLLTMALRAAHTGSPIEAEGGYGLPAK